MESSTVFEFGPFRLAVRERRLLRDGVEVGIPPRHFDVLVLLVQNSPQLVQRTDLLERVWGVKFLARGTLDAKRQ